MDLSSLVDLPALPLRVSARARERLQLPANPGSSLRGAFGMALKRLVCVRPDLSRCAPCPMLAGCAYPQIFEPQARAGEPGTKGFQDLPRPYVVRIPAGEQVVPPGSALSWGMTLVGSAVQQLPYFALAWRAMGEQGLGQGRGRFELEQVEALDLDGSPSELLYDRASNLLRPPNRVIEAADLLAWAG
jgi:hypothetical protein